MAYPLQFLLYVENPARSSAFYADLLGKPAKQLSPFFAVVTLDEGLMLSFWAREKVLAAGLSADGESAEICLTRPEEALRALFNEWQGKGVTMLQAPAKMYFGGWNFLAADPDGHRIRVSTPD